MSQNNIKKTTDMFTTTSYRVYIVRDGNYAISITLTITLTWGQSKNDAVIWPVWLQSLSIAYMQQVQPCQMVTGLQSLCYRWK